eukprot:1900304-Pleurochrysis_carterae.AAC.1
MRVRAYRESAGVGVGKSVCVRGCAGLPERLLAKGELRASVRVTKCMRVCAHARERRDASEETRNAHTPAQALKCARERRCLRVR